MIDYFIIGESMDNHELVKDWKNKFDISNNEKAKNIILISFFSNTSFAEQLNITKKDLKGTLIHIHFARDYIGISMMKSYSKIGCFKCYERQYDFNNNIMYEDVSANFQFVRKIKENKDFLENKLLTCILGNMLSQDFAEHSFIINRYMLSVDKLYIKPNENCSCCKLLRDDNEEASYLEFEEEFLSDLTSFRIKDTPQLKCLKDELIHYKSGFFQNVYRYTSSPFIPIICAEFKDVVSKRIIRSFGRSFSTANVEILALLEGLERYSSMIPRRKESVIYGSYKEMMTKSYNPKEFVLHDDQAPIEEYGLCKYDEDMKINWVWAYSLKNKKPILIPEQIAYFDVNKDQIEKRFVYETSNGVSLGSTLQEAIIYGLFEVIERDAFLMSWYTKYKPKKILIESINDERIKETIKLVQLNGYHIHLFDITTDNNVPTVWVLIEDDRKGAKVRSYTAAGAHINPYKAIEGGIVEAVTSLPVYEEIMPQQKEQAKLLNKYFDKVNSMEDHVLMYSVAESFKHLDYLFKEEIYFTIEELYPRWFNDKKFSSLTKWLEEVAGSVLYNHKDILVVDQSNDLVERYGFKCVKVIVPSMLTMSFGEQFKRLNIDRILKGPVLSGWRKEPIKKRQINRVPHPFP